MLDQVELRWRLRCNGNHTHRLAGAWLECRRAETSTHSTVSPPQPRTEEQPQTCSIRWSFNRWRLRHNGNHTHTCMVGVPAAERRARTLSPPPPRTEEQPQACSIRCEPGSMAAPSQRHAPVLCKMFPWLECRRQNTSTHIVRLRLAPTEEQLQACSIRWDVQWPLCRKGKHLCRCLGRSAGGRDEHAH